MKYPTLTYLGRAGDFKPIRSMISIVDDKEVLVESCKRILECDEIKCSIISHGYLIEVWGSELSVSSFANGSAAISGRIQSLSIERRRSGEALI